MDGPRRRVTWIPALLVAAIPLIPDPPAPVERTPDLDVESVRAAECEYRGITASFDEITRAYALTEFENPRLQGWQARQNPASPETEALVTARFLVDGVRPPEDGDPDPGGARPSRSDQTLEVTWRLNSLAAVPVNAFGGHARGALDSFRRTVDRLLGSMVYLAWPAGLRASPGAADSTRLEAATVLLLEESPDSPGGWTRVRVPADTTAGWVRSDLLRPVHGND